MILIKIFYSKIYSRFEFYHALKMFWSISLIFIKCVNVWDIFNFEFPRIFKKFPLLLYNKESVGIRNSNDAYPDIFHVCLVRYSNHKSFQSCLVGFGKGMPDKVLHFETLDINIFLIFLVNNIFWNFFKYSWSNLV